VPIPDATGHAPPGVEIEVRRLLADGTVGELVPLGESGMLVIRGPNIFAGYLGDTPAPFTEDGWLITGDLGSVAADGLVRISGRAKDLIIRGGHNIDPAVIEDAAAIHPQVATSAAVGRPDVYAGEIPTLYMVLRDDSPEMLADLHEHMGRAVPEPPARPKLIVPLPALPMTSAGKVDKPALRRDAAARVAREILDASPAFAASAIDITADTGPSGRMVLTITLADGGESNEDLAAAVDRLLSGFSIGHRLIFRKEEAPQ
jgi:fatty-acyl-CoA synthase